MLGFWFSLNLPDIFYHRIKLEYWIEFNCPLESYVMTSPKLRHVVTLVRYWIFAPRSATHNVGGWYFEIWNKNRHNRKSQSVQNEFTNIESARSNQRDLRLVSGNFWFTTFTFVLRITGGPPFWDIFPCVMIWEEGDHCLLCCYM